MLLGRALSLPIYFFVLGFLLSCHSINLKPTTKNVHSHVASRPEVFAGPKIRKHHEPISGPLELEHFRKDAHPGCYDRKTRNNWAVVDAHFHARGFGGASVPFHDMITWFQEAGTLFSVVQGIGETLPIDGNCTYYLDCPGTKVSPTWRNDFYNAQCVIDNAEELKASPVGPDLVLSMTFPDLLNPQLILPGMRLLEGEYKGWFRWMGEINVVKQALWENRLGFPIHPEKIPTWAPFMQRLRDFHMPLLLHCDLGSQGNPTQYLPLLDQVLAMYPSNKIVWAHLAGLSKELTPNEIINPERLFQAAEHTALIKSRLETYPNLFIDSSWDILYHDVYSHPEKLTYYVELMNEFPHRFIPGCDFLASGKKTKADYFDQLNWTSYIYRHVSDEAFRLIALGQNYFDISYLNYDAPPVCEE